MRIADWIFLCGFCSLLAFGEQIVSHVFTQPKPLDMCVSAKNTADRSSFSQVCGQKMKFHEAGVNDIALIEGISEKKARQIVEYLKVHPTQSFDGVLAIKGIGPKTVIRLKEHFLP